MAHHPLTVEDLWALPRVGEPRPAPDGRSFVVPVSRWSMETNEETRRLYLVTLDGRGRPAAPRALTSGERSAAEPAWSPDARTLAFVRAPGEERSDREREDRPTHGGEKQLYLLDLEGGEPRRMTDLPLGVTAPRWFPDGKRIAFLSPLYAEAPTPEKTADRHRERGDDPLEVHVTEERVYRFWDRWLTEGRHHHIFVLDVETGALQDITPGNERWFPLMDPTDAYRIAPDGEEIVFAACRSEPPHDPLLWGIFTVRVPRTTKPEGRTYKVKGLDRRFRGHLRRPIYTPDGRYIVYGAQEDIEFYADRVQLVAWDREERRRISLAADWDRSPFSWEIASSDALVLQAEDDGRVCLFKLDLSGGLDEAADRAPHKLARGGSFGSPQPAGERIFTTLSSTSAPPEVVSITPGSGSVRKLTSFTEAAMEEIQLGAVADERFEGADGRRVQMFLVAPPGHEKALEGGKPSGGPLPLVQVIHGGPHGISGDQWHWRWNLQAFAAAGYLVAAVNFHGSTSWGQEFAACIQGAWGERPFRDVMAATDHLVERGLADPDRLAAAGGSYGGYLATWIAAQTDRFGCIVNHAGVCDFQAQLGSDVTQGDERAMGGSLWEDLEGMDAWNPIRHASGFRSPMLVLHGEKDYRVPYYQGLEVYNVYKMMGLPARLVVYPEENHWILTPRASRHWYREVLDWIERWIGPGKKAGNDG